LIAQKKHLTAEAISPSMDSYGVGKGWRCYADNEPGSVDGWPPFIEIYFASLFQENSEKYVLKLDRWMINNSAIPVLVGKGYALYPCNSADNCGRT
jgi:hypothetical protein